MQNASYKNGFTLVETLVAISILVMVIVGPMTIAQKGIQNAYFANDRVTAVFLAQEAIEGVRELRDEVALEAYKGGTVPTANWLPSDDCDGSPKSCAFLKGNTTPFQPCGSTNDHCVLQTDSNGVYSHTSGTPSPFTRTVTIGGAISGGVPVEVSVAWENKGVPHEVKLQTWIYNHYQRYEN